MPLVLIVPADLVEPQRFAAHGHPLATQPGVVGTRAPHVAIVSMVPLEEDGAVEEVLGWLARIGAAQVAGQHSLRRHEAPHRLREVGATAVAHRGPSNPAIAHAPLDPRRAPGRVGDPDPLIRPDPAAVVVGRPTEGLGGDPGEAEVGDLPEPVGVRHIARHRRDEGPAVGGVVVPGTVWAQGLVEGLHGRHVVARRIHRHVDVHGPGFSQQQQRYARVQNHWFLFL